ncbi:MAG: HAD-IA family hydrolase [Bifidobacteriaceae bacterium]|jgi:beta-phosphoglucomutase family hydrolase|nr:HAD-IA family hydrolase [Bifidobacteriaceae bacterium]
MRELWPGIDAFLFDLDGVLTPTAELHRQAWRATIAPFLAARGGEGAGPARPVEPYSEEDYFRHIDGKPRFEGVASVLESRGLRLPFGSVLDPPGEGSVGALGNRKNAEFARLLAAGGVAAYPGTAGVLEALAAAGKRLAVVSSSKNAVPVLEAAGLTRYFELVVDGVLAAREHLAGKPSPETYLYAARRLGVRAGAAAVIEDAISGVEAGRAGAFGLVVGLDRGVGRQALERAGATMVIDDIRDLLAPARPEY